MLEKQRSEKLLLGFLRRNAELLFDAAQEQGSLWAIRVLAEMARKRETDLGRALGLLHRFLFRFPECLHLLDELVEGEPRLIDLNRRYEPVSALVTGMRDVNCEQVVRSRYLLTSDRFCKYTALFLEKIL